MKIEVDAPQPNQVLVVASDGTRWAAQVIDRAHVREGADYGPFTAALRYADSHLAESPGETADDPVAYARERLHGNPGAMALLDEVERGRARRGERGSA